jgi:hypothetical protein
MFQKYGGRPIKLLLVGKKIKTLGIPPSLVSIGKVFLGRAISPGQK